MTPEQLEELDRLNAELSIALKAAVKIGDAASKPAQRAAQLHKKWLSFYWDSYSKESHAGAAKLLRDAVLIYTGMEK